MGDENLPDWRAELAKGGEAVQRQLEVLVETAQKLATGPGRQVVQRIGRAAGAALEELLSPGDGVAVEVLGMTGAINVAAVPGRVVFGSSTLTGAGTFTATATVIPAEDAPETRLGVSVAYILLTFAAAGLFSVRAEYQAEVGYLLTVFGVILSLAILLWGMRK